MHSRRISLLGSGWLGLALAEHLSRKGHEVHASTTSPERLQDIERSGAQAHLIRLVPEPQGEGIEEFFASDLIVFTIPPSGASHYASTARATAKAALRSGARALIMTSSTSVYPNLCRTVVEEDAGGGDGLSLRRNGAAVFAAEQEFQRQEGLPEIILRLAGLYGYGRHPARYFAGRRDVPDPDAPVNLVHRDDVIRAIETVIEAGAYGQVFNVCSDEHPPRKEYYTAMARALGLDPPTFSNEPAREWKVVDNRRLKEVLAFRYRYPDPAQLAP